ncbi:YhcN/YlaJ family sporulation lipoprotein [Lederbergia sp. NSJ-179]|uniref:YhcN/YlaJ family sporulation lipoprotein n=1 Tax=Lederbergia sp. NSJ-179 TaxID=2931402 RepID=UPI001FD54993|nr:YhcN/YlaJ family sporulation lipoprotein [Lederbergia sp. NSJ-179]MCJ7843269.1 YhcN/YlaJ family sporulation lipoprotein [Lederbergia sp. NSJ-179]
MRKMLIIVLAIIGMSACSQQNVDDNRGEADALPRGVSVKDSHLDDNRQRNATDEERANHLADLAASVPDVHNATAVVVGNLAVVGIDVDQNLERSKVGTIKYSVLESLRHDPQGAGAIVIADPDLNARLREVGDDARAGKPIQGVMNELADIVGRIIPDVPLPEEGKNPEDAVDNQDDQMNNQNKTDLKKTKREQSDDRNQ